MHGRLFEIAVLDARLKNRASAIHRSSNLEDDHDDGPAYQTRMAQRRVSVLWR